MDHLMNVILTIDKEHTALQMTLDCRQGLGIDMFYMCEICILQVFYTCITCV